MKDSQEILRKSVGLHLVPSAEQIRDAHNQKIQMLYGLQDVPKLGRARTARAQQSIDAARESVVENSGNSVRRAQ